MHPDRHPLSFAQQRLWIIDQLAPGTAIYNIPIVLDLDGPLDVDAFVGALNEIVRRHDALRTIFVWEGEDPAQHVQPFAATAVPLHDLSAVPVDQQRRELDRRIEEQIKKPFDLERGPLFRAQLIKCSGSSYVLAACVHHIVFDGWSSGVFLRELVALYQAFAVGQPSPLPALPLQYVQFSVRQREAMTQSVVMRQLAYWREQLKEPRAVLTLSSARPRPVIETMQGRRAHLPLSEQQWTAIQALARREGLTFFMVILAAYATLLQRHSGQDDILIGTPIANRMRPDVEPLIGFFVNTLVLRLDLAGPPTFRQLLAQAKQVAIAAYANQDVPFERVIEELRPARSANQTPLLQTMLVLHNAPSAGDRVTAGDVTIRRRQVSTETAMFDLSLMLRRGASGPVAILETNADLFDEEIGPRLLADFERVLEEAVADS